MRKTADYLVISGFLQFGQEISGYRGATL